MAKEFDLIIHYDRIGESDMYNCHEVGKLVRCKDCKHYNAIFFKDGRDLNGCDVFDWASEPSDYCSFAERREKEDGKLPTGSL